ncbi:MAG: penicillin-binding protein 2 [Actinomycetota bacterium]
MALRLIDRRIGLLFGIFALILLVALGRAIWLGGIRGADFQAAATSQQVSEVVIPARRGTITDRNGVPLAVSEPAADVAATPYLIKDKPGVARRIAPILGQPEADVLSKLSQPGGFVYMARQLPDGKARKLEKLGIEGLDFIPSSKRIYPQKQLAAQVIGTVGIDGVGLAGLEYARNSLLHGSDGKRRLVSDAIGQPISMTDQKAVLPGSSISLTIDAAIQNKAEAVLAEIGKTFSPKGATVIVMDPRSGEILADANWPLADSNDFGSAAPDALTDKSVVSAYEPGSTFKPFTVAGALSEKIITPETTFELGSSIQVADRTINEAHDGGGGVLTTAQILAQSSNVGAVTIGLRLGAKKFDQWVHRFGFGTPTGVDLAGEQGGIVPGVKDYSGSSMGNLPIGQGLAVTPMQMAAAYAAIANGGILRTPRILASIGGRPVVESRGKRVISAKTAESVRKMLEGVVAAGGTASEVSIPGYELAGKTGTANKPDNGVYSETKFVASFVGFAPAKNPRLLVTVMVDEPQGEYYGSVVAAPAFQKITAFALPYLRIPPG